MKAITLTQPWATLVAIGAKRIETRSWSTLYRGELAIHAAKGMPSWAVEFAKYDPRCIRVLQDAGIYSVADLPRSAVVAATRLVNVVPTQRASSEYAGWPYPDPRSDEHAFGDFSPGRFMWFLEGVVALPEPVPARGALGIWEWTP